MKLLKPCQFCGDEAKIVVRQNRKRGSEFSVYVKCLHCGFRTPHVECDEHGVVEAFQIASETWNEWLCALRSEDGNKENVQ